MVIIVKIHEVHCVNIVSSNHYKSLHHFDFNFRGRFYSFTIFKFTLHHCGGGTLIIKK